MNGSAVAEQEQLGVVPPGMEPAPYCDAALEALDLWELMGSELRVETLPVLFAMYPEADAELSMIMLRVINRAVRKSR